MAYYLFGTKSLPEPMMTYSQRYEQMPVLLQWKQLIFI